MGREGRTGKRIVQGAKRSRGIGPRPLDPAVREFLDGLFEIIADLIIEDQGKQLSSVELGSATACQGEATC